VRKALLINGPPASGKTTIAKQLVHILQCPLLSLDTIKEVLFEHLGVGDREFNRKLGNTSLSIIWSITREMPIDAFVMIEAWFGSSATKGIEGQLEAVNVHKVAEIWCHAPSEILATRYLQRVGERHHGHPAEAYASELIKLAKTAAPLGIGSVLSIDTSRELTTAPEDMAAWVRGVLA
jgi:glucokinase